MSLHHKVPTLTVIIHLQRHAFHKPDQLLAVIRRTRWYKELHTRLGIFWSDGSLSEVSRLPVHAAWCVASVLKTVPHPFLQSAFFQVMTSRVPSKGR
jgi:hypothetical protein